LFYSLNSFSNSLMFSEKIYSTIDVLNSSRYEKYDIVESMLFTAREFSPNRDIQKKIDEAIYILQQRNPFIAEQEKVKLTNILKETLTLNRVKLNRSYWNETKLIEHLVKVTLFPSYFDKVDIKFENMEQERGYLLLMTYLADPRSINYESEIAS